MAKGRKGKKAARNIQSAPNQKLRVNNRGKDVSPGVHIAECSAHYAMAVSDPFTAWNDNIPPVCVPDNVVLPTVKQRFFARGAGATGTTGFGYVTLSPYPPCSDTNSVISTTATSVMTATTTLSAVTNYQYSHFASPFTESQLGAAALQYRIVAAAIRVRYSGTKLNEGGNVFAFRNPTNQNSNGSYSYNSIAQQPTAKYFTNNSEWVSLSWRPATSTDYSFSYSTTPSYCLTIAIQSAAVAMPFEYETVIFVEWLGASSGVPTVSHSDPVGFGAIQEVLTTAPESHSGTRKHINIIKSVGDAIAKTASFVYKNRQVLSSAAKSVAALF
jgi:hypothetical protein